MKTSILTIVVLAAAVAGSHAQNSGREKFAFGLKIGANYANVYDQKGEKFNADPRFGLAAGAFFAIPLGKFVGIQPEILYSEKGFKAKGQLLGVAYDVTRTSSYLDIPLLLAVKPIPFLTILAGPQFSYLLKQKDSFSGGGSSIDQQKIFNNDNLRKNTLGFVGGLDINLDHLVIGARVGWDFLNNNGDGTSTTPRYKNTWLQATLGYRLF